MEKFHPSLASDMALRIIKQVKAGTYQSPLDIRGTVDRLRKSPQKGRHIRRLLWPFPWYFQPANRPFDMVNIGPNKDIVHVLHPDIRQLQCIPLFRARDTPLCSIYRMFESLCAREDIWMGYECQYFFYHSETRWHLSRIADPHERDPVVYAVLASLVDALVTAFNWKLRLGIRRTGRNNYTEDRSKNFELEAAPAWVTSVPPLEKMLDLHTDPNSKDGEPHSAFLRRNIKVCVSRMYDV